MVRFRIYLHPIGIAVLAAPLILGALLGIVPWWSVAVEIATLAVVSARALAPLGLLNFLVLQWFGVRVCRHEERVTVGHRWSELLVGSHVGTVNTSGERHDWRVADVSETSIGLRRHSLARWIWPLTGWWTEYRWIARRA